MATFESTLKSKLIYVFAINDERHGDCLKIGETTIEEDDGTDLFNNSEALQKAAHRRIQQYTKTAGIAYQLLHTEISIFMRSGMIMTFNDKQVHHVLERSGIRKKEFADVKGADEWYCCDLETINKAISAIKRGETSLKPSDISHGLTPIVFRPEQSEAIKKTRKRFQRGNHMLWNAKMRFGKTLSALQIVKEEEYTRTLILTHRPVVDEGWFEDFGKIFFDRTNYKYGSRNKGEEFEALQRMSTRGMKYVYFASMQDLRGSEQVGGKFDKNNEIFSTPWDFLIVDEAHEGTKTELGQNVLKELIKPPTKVLQLSGTPFNLFDDYAEEEIYTWDYVMEQKAKQAWAVDNPYEPNPYASLPSINIYTYDLGNLMSDYAEDEKAFNFKEFFRTRDDGTFIHEADIDRFLNLLCKDDKDSLYPYSNETFRRTFRHTLWLLPGVKAARALSAKLQAHDVFGNFQIVNVAGNGDEDEENDDALRLVNKAIGEDASQTYTITLSCGRLTTGVSVKPWTAVFMMAGSFSTSAAQYMQTIFRVQTPFTCHGRMKDQCYAFDFAPDRTLRVLAETAKVSAKAGKQTEEDRRILGDFLNFCPIISVEGSQMKPYDVNKMMKQLKKAQIEKVVQNGFEDGALYNDELLKLTDVELKEFANLKKIIGSTKAMSKTGDIDINNQGFTNEQYEEKERLEKKPKKERTPEEQARLDEYKAKQNERKNAISILRGISIRMPLLIYGAELTSEEEEITIDNFASLIDDQSWEEFMPKGVDKERFELFKKYYDPDIFREAGKDIREKARVADKFTIEERIERISAIFNTFRNPDKETVLTPWRVVNMHMSDCLGGWCFYDEKFEHTLDVPRYVSQGKVTQDVFRPDSHILEINSKSGLYPLYVAYNIYRSRVEAAKEKYGDVSHGFAMQLWDATIEENILVICKTPMAKSITRRTLAGFRNTRVNAQYYPNLIENISEKPNLVVNTFRDGKRFWKINNEENMKIDAIVGNPPYQVMDGGAGASAMPVYNKFVEISKLLQPKYTSLIMPARWYAGGRGLDSFRKEMLEDKHIQVLYDYVNGKTIFNNVEIKGGICYFLWNRSWLGKCKVHSHVMDMEQEIVRERFLKNGEDYVFIRDPRLLELKNKVTEIRILLKEKTFDTMVSSMKPYGLRGDFFKDPSKYNLPPISGTNIQDGITIVGLGDNLRRKKMYVKKNYPIPNREGMDKYKIFVPRNMGTGKYEDMIFTTYLANPYEICTETFVQVYPFNNALERDNCNSYLRTKFFRMILCARKMDQGTSKEVYSFVPLQDFTENSDIDWSKPIKEIDTQLYKKYKLTEEEINFIESMIKPME
ncbi:MAG: Eco57I restriction-modification methylase domain-containing protein [Prevotella sp.]|nr:Eco57I restriction-modification methylase domain-containing protein [Prevotella sp.]